MAYSKTIYANGEAPALNLTNLNNTEDGVEANDLSITAIEADILKHKRRIQLGVDM